MTDLTTPLGILRELVALRNTSVPGRHVDAALLEDRVDRAWAAAEAMTQQADPACMELQDVWPDGWKIERANKAPFRRISIRGPDGINILVQSHEFAPAGVMYRLLDAMLRAR